MSQYQLQTARFGAVAYLESDVVRFPEGLLGFSDCTRFLVLAHREGSRFRWLQSIDEPTVAFLVSDPANFVEDYAPEMPDAVARELELTEETPRLVYTIVTIPKGQPEAMTANLAGPIVINVERGLGKQIVLEDSSYPVRFPLIGTSAKAPTESAVA